MNTIFFTVTTDLNYDQRMIRICESLTKAGYDVQLVGRLLPHSRALADRSYLQHRIKCFFNAGKLFYLEYNLRLLWYLMVNKMDAICSVDLDTILPGYIVCRLKSRLHIYDAHEYFTELPEVVGRPLVKKAWETVAGFCLPYTAHAYTVGPCLAAIFAQKYHQPYAVIRNVPYVQPFPSDKIIEQRFQDKILLYQGALNEGRGLEAMIGAMSKLKDVQLWLAGEGDLSDYLREMVEQGGLGEQVKFLGYLLPAELKEVTRQATIGLNLLENKGMNYYYSLANKCFDYIQAAVPALHMRFPEYENINKEFEVAVLLDELDTDAIASAIDYLLSNKSRYIQMAFNCREAALQLNWEKESEKLIAFYKNILPNDTV